MHSELTRREFCRDAALIGAATVGLGSASRTIGADEPGPMPRIKIGGLEISRLILGTNPFNGFSHNNPQATSEEMKAFYTPERIMAVLDAAADHGITAVWGPAYENWVRLWNEYKDKGGRLEAWIGQPDRMPMEKELEACFRNGAKAVCIQGCRIDDQVKVGKWDVVRGWLELIKSHGLPAGMATHGAKTHLEAEERNLPTDFYHQTLYRPDNYVPEGLVESLATIAKLDKPVIAYKVLGAGRILPKDQLPHVLKHLKPKDGLCLGMFPKKRDEVAENADLVRTLSARA